MLLLQAVGLSHTGQIVLMNVLYYNEIALSFYHERELYFAAFSGSIAIIT